MTGRGDSDWVTSERKRLVKCGRRSACVCVWGGGGSPQGDYFKFHVSFFCVHVFRASNGSHTV